MDKRSGVSQRLPITALENVVSNAERRALVNGEAVVVPRVSDIYAALPSLTGKIELEYEGELKGAETVARELVRAAVATVFDGHAPQRRHAAGHRRGSSAAARSSSSDTTSAAELLGARRRDRRPRRGVAAARRRRDRDAEPLRAAVADFVLEGLCALKKISRTDEGRLFASAPPAARQARQPRRATLEQLMEEDDEPAAEGQEEDTTTDDVTP